MSHSPKAVCNRSRAEIDRRKDGIHVGLMVVVVGSLSLSLILSVRVSHQPHSREPQQQPCSLAHVSSPPPPRLRKSKETRIDASQHRGCTCDGRLPRLLRLPSSSVRSPQYLSYRQDSRAVKYQRARVTSARAHAFGSSRRRRRRPKKNDGVRIWDRKGRCRR